MRDNWGQSPLLARGDEADVRDPDAIRRGHVEVPLQQIRSGRGALARGVRHAKAPHPPGLDAVHAAQASDPVVPTAQPFGIERTPGQIMP